MKLQNKYAVGCHVMFYEIEILTEYLNSLKISLQGIENPKNVIVDLFFNISEFFEEVDEESKVKIIKDKIKNPENKTQFTSEEEIDPEFKKGIDKAIIHLKRAGVKIPQKFWRKNT